MKSLLKMNIQRRILFSLLIISLVFFIFELITRAYLYSVYKTWIPTKVLFQSKYSYQDEKLNPGCTWGDSVELHPILSVTYHHNNYCKRTNINAYGLIGAEIEPKKDRRFYNILVLGGSVAEKFTELNRIEKILNEKFYSPNQMPFRIINGAIAGGRQPIQIISYLLFSDKVDAVLSIEGFNESHLFGMNDPLESPQPAWENLVKIQKKDFYNLFFQDLSSKIFNYFKNNYPFYHFSFLFLISEKSIQLSQISINETRRYLPVIPYGSSQDELKNDFFYRYEKYLSHLSALTKVNQQPLAIFIQPVPALYKKLTQDEKQKVGDLRYAKKYLEITNHLLKLQNKNIPVYSLLQVFKEKSESIYIDNIHFKPGIANTDGNYIISSEIATVVGKVWNLKKKITIGQK